MQCPHENPAGARFGNECGAKLEATCAHCGQLNAPSSRFCNGCGQRLAGAGDRRTRREFMQAARLGGLALLAACGKLPGQGQATPKVYRVGYLSPLSAPAEAPRYAAFQKALRELGWVEGQNFVVDIRWAEGQSDRLPGLAAELAQLHPDVIVTSSDPGIKAMKGATSTIPVVFSAHGDPVGTQAVASLAHPGGNVTGVTEMAPELAGKRLELLKQAVPTVARAGAIWNLSDQAMAREYGETLVAAESLGIELQNLGVRTPEELDGAYQTAIAGRMDGAVVLLDPLVVRSRDRLVELSTRSRVPTISGDAVFAAAGGLMSYGPSLIRQVERAAYFVDRILKGTEPADLPVERPMLFDFVINLKTAQALGLTIPQHVQLQATEAIP